MSHNIHPKYRPDIDGLRAVAIALVVLFHAFPTALTGGFIGVDIFFVISGYLISTIIFNALEQNRFSFRDFYARRVKRIFPAFLTVMVGVLVAAWAFLLPDELHALAKHAFNGLLFIVNVNFMQEHGYFDIASERKPLLHLWSLCIEEQYYLLWPLLACGFWKLSHHRLRMLLPVIGVSFVACVIVQRLNPLVAFYLPFTRFWELLGGSLLAHLTLRGQGPSILLSRLRHITLDAARHVTSLLGVACLAAAAIFFGPQTAFPGYAALLPIIGAMLLIDAGPHAFFNRYFLSSRPFVALGLISYPLYLWHWPLLSFGRIVRNNALSHEMTMALVAAAIVLATLTYWLVEKPLRFSPRITHKTRISLLSWLVIFCASLFVYKDLLSPRLQNEKSANFLLAIHDWNYPGWQNFNRTEDFQNFVSNPQGKDSVLIMGDSHMEHYWVRLQKNVSQDPAHSPRLVSVTYGGCLPMPSVTRPVDAHTCPDFYRYAMQQAEKTDVKTIVISGYWEAAFGVRYGAPSFDTARFAYGDKTATPLTPDTPQTHAIFDAFAADLLRLHKMGKRVFVVLSNPTHPAYDPANMFDRISGDLIAHDISRQDYLDYTAPVRKLLLDAIRKGHATALDPVPFLCGKTTCPTTENGQPLYKDENHLRPTTILKRGAFLDAAFAKESHKR